MEIDRRILNLSYSSRQLLKQCARRFQLYRLNGKEDRETTDEESLTFQYGHTVGKGVQDIFEGLSLEKILWNAFTEWNIDLALVDEKRNKSFYGALHAIRQLYYAIRENGFLKEYDLVYHNGKPAVELGFLIRLPNGFVYRGRVDLVLRNRLSGEVVVIECKTVNAYVVNPAQYKNSAQAIGYSIVLDALFPDLSSYKVYYLVYPTKKTEWITIPFEKSYLQRALWIRELLLDCDMISLYEEAQIYPMNGDACYNFNRECEYLQTCTLSTHHLVDAWNDDMGAKIDSEHKTYEIQIGIEDLIEAQMKKNVSVDAGSDMNETSDEMI